MSFNKEFADNFIISQLCSFSLDETLVKEIEQIPANSFIVINIQIKKIKIYYIDYQQNTIPLESREGLELIDKWVDKWGYIIRSIKKKTKNISSDLSGGFDTRTLLSILLNFGINLNYLFIHSSLDKSHDHDIDFKIASKISEKLGFRLNKGDLDENSITWSRKDTILNEIYLKLGFHKEFKLRNKFFIKPRFALCGFGGEALRGVPGIPIQKYIEKISNKSIFGHREEFYNSSIRLLNRSVYLLQKKKSIIDDYEISNILYIKSLARNHFGKAAIEGFLANIYSLNPLMDPEIRKIKFNVSGAYSHDLVAYIYVRFARSLVDFQFQGNRTLNLVSIKKAEQLNSKLLPYKIKSNFNKNFYIDDERESPSPESIDNKNAYEYLGKLFQSPLYIKSLNKYYDIRVYNWAKYYSLNSNYFPFRHHYALLAIAITLENLSLNEIYLNKTYNQRYLNNSKIKSFIIK